jgi:hypothetical protein
MKRLVRIEEIVIGEMTYYEPQIQRHFLCFKWWTSIGVYIYSGNIFYGGDHLSSAKWIARCALDDYKKLTREELIYRNGYEHVDLR